jgi:hypothetical protein
MMFLLVNGNLFRHFAPGRHDYDIATKFGRIAI